METQKVKVLTTERPEGPVDKSTLRTPSGEANVEVVTLNWYSQVGIRVARTYVQSLVGFILAAGTGAAAAVGVNLPVGDFSALLWSCASMAVAPAVISLLQNAVEILTRLDVTSPQVRA